MMWWSYRRADIERAIAVVHPEHASHGVRVFWRQLERPFIALVCGCGQHLDVGWEACRAAMESEP